GTLANLNPGIDSASSTTAAPGHTYRITVDGRFSNEARVTVERDSGTGFVVLPGLNAVNVLAAVNSQAPLPSDFYLSLTGSTGGSTNIHELDDLQVCATDINPIGQQIDHFEFSYSGTALTCNPQPVTIRACLSSSCSSLYTNPVSVTLSPASYWTATPPATVSGSTITFSGGSALAQLRVPTAGSVALAAQSSVPTTKPNSQTVCSTAGCQINYADSGLLLQVPNLLAAKPTPATISAVRKSDDALQCVPAFANVDRVVQFTSAYADPATGSQLVVVNGSNVGAVATSINLSFDSTGTAPLLVRYDDAGLMTLDARYSGSVATGDVGLLLHDDDQFVSKPYGLLLETDTGSSCTADINCPLYPNGVRAGDPFSLRIKAVAWQSDGEALTAAALGNNLVTANFQLGDITLTSAVVAPSDGVAGALSPGDYDHLLGSQTSVDTAISEVGVFRLSATPTASYFGETVSGGTSGLVGRFIPAYLGAAGDASLTPSCGSAFSYQGQPMDFADSHEPTLTITAYNRGGNVTTNYDRGDFWRLSTPAVGSYSSVTGIAGLDARLASQGTASLLQEGAGDGDGARSYRWSDEQLRYDPALLPSGDDYPVMAKLQQRFAAAALTDQDDACHGSGTACEGFTYDFADAPGSEVRLGRLRIDNAHGSELQSLGLPIVLESWQSAAGGSFQFEGLDTCTTAAVLGAPLLDQYTAGLAAGETVPSLSWPLNPAEHLLLLSAPGSGNDGSVQASFPLAPTWLQYPWDGVSRSAARGLATFGIYKGAAPLIFRREIYGQ
ncbi:MAG: MSHA biogenesis protein MshQ, partial [Pseudomonas sp.]|nr:MSHA biogenesis protein MshQ [Pseudomonas sp.]